MGFFSELKKLTRPYDDEDDEFRDFTPQTQSSSEPGKVEQMRSSYAGFEEKRDSDKIVSVYATTRLQVVLVKPDRFEAAAEIVGHLKEQRTVLLNLEDLDKATAQRIIDFVSGACYTQDGNIEKIAERSYIITPYNVTLVGDLADEIENHGLFY